MNDTKKWKKNLLLALALIALVFGLNMACGYGMRARLIESKCFPLPDGHEFVRYSYAPGVNLFAPGGFQAAVKWQEGDVYDKIMAEQFEGALCSTAWTPRL